MIICCVNVIVILVIERNKQESMRTGAQPLDEQDGKETRNQEKGKQTTEVEV